MFPELSADRVRMLRAVGSPRDALALRLGLERVLGATDLRPAGLSRGSILCVRRLRVGLPPPNARAWSDRLDLQMQDLLGGASRPFYQSVPDSVPAVLFSDEAELIACLARDWRRGDVHAWWWRSLFGEAVDEALVRRVHLEAVIFVPASIDLLFRAGILVDVVSALPSLYCERLGAAVASTFAIPGWEDWLLLRDELDQPHIGDRGRVGPAEQGRVPGRPPTGFPTIDEVVSLTAPQRALLGIGLLLQRAPALARAPRVLAALRQGAWWSAPNAPDSQSTHAQQRSGVAEPLKRRSVQNAGSAPPLPRVGDQDGCELPPLAIPDHPTETTPIPAPEASIEPSSSSGPLSRPAVQVLTSPADSVDSEFAGVLYLVNLALYLELYGDFTQPARPGLALPLGDFLALVGERGCGPSLLQDPLWEVLAQLAGREADEPPAREFIPPDQGDSPSEDSVSRWLDRLIPTLEVRAASALEITQGGALAFLCARSGRLALTPTRLDAVFQLATHPFGIRMSGLDRNPGWVPAAGRIIEFHYV